MPGFKRMHISLVVRWNVLMFNSSGCGATAETKKIDFTQVDLFRTSNAARLQLAVQ